jgi:hypothetical protein
MILPANHLQLMLLLLATYAAELATYGTKHIKKGAEAPFIF